MGRPPLRPGKPLMPTRRPPLLSLPPASAPSPPRSSRLRDPSWTLLARLEASESLSTLARVTFSGRETFPPQLCPILKALQPRTSRLTWDRSSTTSTRPPTSCSPPRPLRILPAGVKTEVEGLIEKKKISLDLYEI